MTQSKKFEFDPPMQDDILKLCISSPLFAEASTHWVKPDSFGTAEQVWFSNTINEFTIKYGMPPTVGEVKQTLRLAVQQSEVKATKALKYEAFITKIFNEPLDGSREFAIEQVKQFAQQRAWEKAIMDAVPLVKQGKFAEMAVLMEEAQNAVFDIDAGGYWYFETMEERARRRLSGEDLSDVIPMGVMELDVLRRRRGLGKGEACVWIAPKGGGKSIALGHVTRRAIFDTRNVAYFSFEMDDEQNAERLDSGFSGVDMWDMKAGHERVLAQLRPLSKRFPRSLFIKRYPTKGASVQDMHRCLQNLEKAHKWRPDLIVMDYLTIARPRSRREKRNEEILELSEDFRWLLGVWECAGHTAAQLNRSGARMQTAEGTEVAGAWDALAIFDLVYIINQSKDEKDNKELRIFIDKDRDGIDKKEILGLQTAWERMCFSIRPNKMPWKLREELLYKTTS